MTLTDRARNVRLLCVDVDGVLTDAGMYYGPEGEVLKKFNTRDGMGLARVIMLLLHQPSIREVTYLFRGPNRLAP